jgi:hypothetical protein
MEARSVTMTEDWTKWESQIVNGVFPLRRFLGKSDHCVVFLTEAQSLPNAVIKLVPADPVQAEDTSRAGGRLPPSPILT